MHRSFVLLLLLLSAVLISAALQPRPAVRRPNIVFILADDLGYSDLRCYGNPFNETPVLDSLARHGLRFTQAYAAAPVCSPSRAALLTGKHPARLHLTNFLVGDRVDSASPLRPAPWRPYLPGSEVTLAERLKALGYATGMVGKWHLGSADSLTPTAQGFDYERQISKNGLDYYNYGISSANKPVFEDKGNEYLTDKLTDYALEFLGQQTAQKPFFLYLAYSAPHILLVPRADKLGRFLYRYPRFKGKYNPSYAAMLLSMDEGIGRVLQQLKANGFDDNTLVIFTSDNGGLGMPEAGPAPTDNAPLRSWKGHLYEGGIRVPMIMRWKGVIPENTVTSQYLTGTDFVPTLLELLGAPKAPFPDGRSFAALLRNPAQTQARGPVFWHYPHFSNQLSAPSGAIREGDYKLIEHFETGRTELYNLTADLSETTDLSAREPAKTRDLHQKLKQWRAEVRANMPLANPAFSRK
ncbi:sulfatase [Tellurirhabdus rosea]|uniref:sulfatase n=1 Tax=Tellurirhabdus rosea TaxID=2674997 RepID=UPI0022571648|nr:sulfatase [Tellurirhabdus rosea]